jgi:hypothetical protein
MERDNKLMGQYTQTVSSKIVSRFIWHTAGITSTAWYASSKTGYFAMAMWVIFTLGLLLLGSEYYKLTLKDANESFEIGRVK